MSKNKEISIEKLSPREIEIYLLKKEKYDIIKTKRKIK